MPEDKKPEQKKALSQTLLAALIGALFVMMILQNIFETKVARVSFSYQLEHLVNLDLLSPEDSKKIASGPSLVTFYGHFRDAKTEESRKRFAFLELLEEQNQLSLEQQRVDQDLQSVKKRVEASSALYLQMAGTQIPKGGFEVVSDYYNTADRENSIRLTKDAVEILSPRKDVVTVQDLLQAPDNTDDELIGDIKSLRAIVSTLRSPLMGIGNDDMKRSLKTVEADIERTRTQLEEKGKTPSTQFKTTYENSLKEVSKVVQELGKEDDHMRLTALRSVRDYKEFLTQYNALQSKIEENSQKLERAYSNVSDAIWYFNNEEVSSRMLEKQEPELFHQWFIDAKEEWSNFDANKSAYFKAPDQPLNKVLEKEFQSEELPTNYMGYLLSMAPILLILFLLYLAFSRQVKGMGGNPMDFGKSPARLYPKGSNLISFKDVAGIDDSLEELQEVVEFLKSPQKFTALGAKIPKGVLCVGPPGTGKTLVARAVAGEADCPFFSISGSDFVEMFVGVGASRIRKMFEEAKKNAPCIIFIDEIDAVGRHRGAGIGGGHDEREQTLNQLLVEMDGFDTNEGIIIIAATNRPDVLDKALLRPGRFDRQVIIGLPDIKGRFDILKVHAKKVKLDDSVDLMALAKSTPGCSGADLANLLNEAALLAARRNRMAVTSQDILDARDKVLYGKERRSMELDKKEKLHTAYHESGHAIIGCFVDHSDPIDKVTIIPRGMSLGSTLFLPEKNRVSYWKKELIDQIAVLMGGRIAEEMFVGDLSSGARQDIERATNIARMMVCELGMSERIGSVTYEERSENGQYLGMSGYREKKYSEKTAQEIDDEIKRILEAGNARAKKILEENRDIVELMTKMLMEFETLDSEDVQKLIHRQWDIEEKRKRLQAQLERMKIPPEEVKELVPPPIPPEAYQTKEEPSSQEEIHNESLENREENSDRKDS